MSQMNQEKLKEFLFSEGASIAGFSNLQPHLPPALSPLSTGITIGVRLSDFIINQIENAPTYSYYHHYRTVNTLIDLITLKTTNRLQSQGYQAMAIAASQTVTEKGKDHYGIFPHKTAATLAGLGWIGKSTLFISDELGPRVRLGTVLTDMPLTPGAPRKTSGCGDCTHCRDACPAGAIHGRTWSQETPREELVDVRRCADYMRTHFSHPGRGSVCGICIRVCPVRSTM
jgi:epoxyqueuosine reductase QueG